MLTARGYALPTNSKPEKIAENLDRWRLTNACNDAVRIHFHQSRRREWFVSRLLM